jgi:hypothetical protein
VASPWITAAKATAKVIPWAEVAKAAPGLIKGAQDLWKRAGRKSDNRVEIAPDGASEAAPAKLAALQARVAELRAEVTTSTELITRLAEQNASLIAAIEALRKKTRLLAALAWFSLGGLLLLVLWIASRAPA